MKKYNVISFSLWGSDPSYIKGAIKNIKEAKKIYPEWICRFYCAKNSPAIKKLRPLDCEVIPMKQKRGWGGLFWRFYATSDPKIDRCIIRDCDSVVNHREATAVKKWIRSKKDFHIMNDSLHHGSKIMGGMWGIKGKVINDMKKRINKWIKKKRKGPKLLLFSPIYHGLDQIFLNEEIWPIAKDNCLIHGIKGKPFPNHKSMKYGTFIGEKIFYSKIKQSTIIKSIDAKLGEFGIFLKKHHPKLYFKLKKLKEK